jgi:prepilin-type N-terminal cleavage/methylation domain-containing protein
MLGRRSKRGFTLLEIIIAISIVALILTLGIPQFWNAKKRSQIRGAARLALENIKQARVLAGSGTSMQSGLGIARYSGISVLSPTSYGVILDANTVPNDGNEAVLRIIDFRTDEPATTLTIAWNPTLSGNVLYFQSNGQVWTPSPPNLVITDSLSGFTQTIQIAQSGTAKIVE